MTAKFIISSDAKMLTFALTDPKGKSLDKVSNKNSYEYKLVAKTAGNYQLCITNGMKNNATISFTIESGVQAIDYNNIVQK